ncbi:MAG: transcriptional repressor [Candidatus Marinimicrobia bacterium]|nr:transcriptional repressor [Candidatus Neomarinimicrobiota bacterium]
MNTAVNNTKNILLSKGITPTFQRIVIYEFLDQNRIHPNVDTIFAMMTKQIPTISRTTIYNTLNLFMEKNLVSGLSLNGNEMNFDINTHPHHHFYCTICKKITDIEITCPIGKNKLKNPSNHLIQEVHGYFKGICKDCLSAPSLDK